MAYCSRTMFNLSGRPIGKTSPIPESDPRATLSRSNCGRVRRHTLTHRHTNFCCFFLRRLLVCYPGREQKYFQRKPKKYQTRLKCQQVFRCRWVNKSLPSTSLVIYKVWCLLFIVGSIVQYCSQLERWVGKRCVKAAIQSYEVDSFL